MPTPSDKAAGYKAPAVHKAFELLRTVAESENKLGLTELALQLGYSKSTTHGLVHALMRERALVQDPAGRKLFIGPAIANLAFTSWNYLRIAELAQPIINDLRNQIKETVFLGALINGRVLVMATAEADVPLKISAAPGTRLPLIAGAVGKVMLSRETPELAMSLIRKKGLPQHTSKSIVDETLYLEELERVRLSGYAVDNEEYLSGVRAVAVALDNFNGPPMAAWVVGLSSTMSPQKIEMAADMAKMTAKRLQAALDKQLLQKPQNINVE